LSFKIGCNNVIQLYIEKSKKIKQRGKNYNTSSALDCRTLIGQFGLKYFPKIQSPLKIRRFIKKICQYFLKYFLKLQFFHDSTINFSKKTFILSGLDR